jgi:hypothetical protein
VNGGANGTGTGPGGTGTGTGTGGTGTGGASTRALTIRVTGASLRRGVRLRVTVPGRGRVSGTATTGRLTLASAAARTVTRGGTVGLVLRPTKAGRRALRGVRRKRVTVRVTFRAPGAPALTARRTRVTVVGGRR